MKKHSEVWMYLIWILKGTRRSGFLRFKARVGWEGPSKREGERQEVSRLWKWTRISETINGDLYSGTLVFVLFFVFVLPFKHNEQKQTTYLSVDIFLQSSDEKHGGKHRSSKVEDVASLENVDTQVNSQIRRICCHIIHIKFGKLCQSSKPGV